MKPLRVLYPLWWIKTKIRMKNVTLILDDGSRFHGKSFGYEKPVAGEVVFNTDRKSVV